MRARAPAALLAALAVLSSGCFGPTENQAPSAHASASSGQAAVGEDVIFTGTALDTDGSIVLFEWDFEGDGLVDFSNATRGSAAFAFTQPGVFTARFTATDDRGASATDTVVVAVIARFALMADWGADEGYLIQSPPGLDVAALRVRVSPSGAPAPYDFAQGAGLVSIDNTTYRVAVPLSTLERYSVTRVEVSYNGTLGGDRVFRAVPYFGAENDTSVVFSATLDEVRIVPGSNTALAYAGALQVASVGAAGVASFAGSGSSRVVSSEGEANSTADYLFSSVAWNHSIGVANGSFAALDFAWSASGTLVSQTSSGFTTNLSISRFEGARLRGNLTFERVEGAGTYLGELPATSGTAAYSLFGNETLTFADGNGFPRRALRLSENRSWNGTFGGASFVETNVSERFVAASDTFVHGDLFVSWNSTGRVGSTNLSDAGSRYLDFDGDGVYNPDPRPAFPSDGQYFAGLAPADLKEGDVFTVRNAQGAAARLTVGAPSIQVLLAQGFTAVAVEVVTVQGAVAGGAVTGSLSAEVVASGPHAGLRLAVREDLFSSTGSFSSRLTLAARSA